MAAYLTVDAFLDVVRRSRLVRPEDLERVLKQLEETGVDVSSSKALAQALTDQQIVTRWQADYLLQGKHKGFFLGPYRFLKLLGKGGMGAVYLAQHEMMRRRCAIKVLPAKMLKDGSSVLERFYLEAQAVAALDHPNIVRAYDVNKEVQGASEIHYLVMEFVEGQDLQTMVQERGRGLEFVEVADYVRQAACGLAHAHENGLIHRDIKPANLLVDGKGVVKVLDLGLARFFDDRLEASLTKAYNESILGTADYLSPEQALNSHQVDTRTDIYSLGCTCYYLLTGQPPFPDGSVAQRLIAHQVKSPTAVDKLRPGTPGDLVSIVERMIAKKPENRYQTAGEVAEALRAFLLVHADAAWKQQHRDVVGEGSGIQRPASAEPTRAKSAASEDTELGLGLAPGQDSGLLGTSPVGDAAAAKKGGSSKNLSQVAAAEAVDAGSGLTPLPNVAGESREGAVVSDLLSQPLDDIFSQPSFDALAGDPLSSSSQSMPTVANAMGSGPYQLGSAAAAAEHSESRQLMWLLLVGLGISTPLAGVILFMSYWNVPKEITVAPAVTHRTQPAAVATRDNGRRAAASSPAKAAAPNVSTPSPSAGTSPTPPPPEMTSPPTAPANWTRPPADPGAATPPPTVPGAANAPPVEYAAAPAPPPNTPVAPPGAAGFPPNGATPGNVDPAPATALGGGANPPAAAVPPQPNNAADAQKQPTAADAELSDVDRQRLLASLGTKTVSVTLNREAKNKIELMVMRTAFDRLQKELIFAQYGGNKQDPAILNLSLSYGKPSPLMTIALTAELSYARDDGKRVVVWTSTAEVGQVSSAVMQRPTVPNVVRNNVDDFFEQMIRDYRKAAATHSIP